MATHTLTEQPGDYAVCMLSADAPLPDWALQGHFWSVTRTDAELSVICAAHQVPPEITMTAGWVLLRVEGPFDFDVTGVLAALTQALADADVPCLALATYQTDYLLVQKAHLPTARKALTTAGHHVHSNADTEQLP